MANVKITELTAITAPASSDVLAIVDVDADVTKKVTIANLVGSAAPGSFGAPSFGFADDDDTGMYRAAADQLGFATAGAERLRLDAAGNVHINGDAKYLYLSSDDHQWIRADAANDVVQIGTSNVDRLRIDSSGNVGIGTSSPSNKLHTEQSSNGTIAAFNYTSSSGGGAEIRVNNGFSGTVPVYGFWFNNSTGIGNPAANIVSVINAGTESARVDSSGRVLINRTNSTGSHNLEVHGGTDNEPIKLSSSDAGAYLAFADDGTTGSTRLGAVANDLKIDVNSAERMRITSAGMVGIATTSKLDSNNVSLAVAGVHPATPIEVQQDSTSAHFCITFRNGNGLVGNIQTSGSSTSYNTSSDHRLKENIVDIADGITRVKQLQPKRFNFIADADTTVDGFIAHEAQTVVPEAVTGTHNEVDADGNAVMQGIDQAKLVPLLTAALQEAIAKIETLETKVAALEAG